MHITSIRSFKSTDHRNVGHRQNIMVRVPVRAMDAGSLDVLHPPKSINVHLLGFRNLRGVSALKK